MLEDDGYQFIRAIYFMLSIKEICVVEKCNFYEKEFPLPFRKAHACGPLTNCSAEWKRYFTYENGITYLNFKM